MLVEEENRPHLSELLIEGDPAVAEALAAYWAHKQRARGLLREGSVPAEEIPTFLKTDTGKQVLRQPPRRLISLAISLMADKATRVRRSERFAPLIDIDHLTERLLDRLATRKLPFTPQDAAVAIDLVTAHPWLEQLRFALHAARSVLDDGDAPAVLAALRRLDTVFVDEPQGLLISKTMSYHPQIRTLLGTHTGAGSSTVFGTDDAYGPAAVRLVDQEHAAWDAVGALTFLAGPRGTRAPAAWWEEAETRTTGTRSFGRLVVDLLGLVSAVDLTDGSIQVHGVYHPAVVLLGEINTIIVRGAAWSARFVDQPEAVLVLNQAVLRCSSLVQGLWGMEPMSSKVAYAAVDSLVALESKVGRPELEQLLSEVQATPVLRRIGNALAVPEQEIRSLIRQRSRNRMVHRRRSGN